MDEDSKKFLLSEYSSLRQEILDTVKEVPSNEKFALVFSGVYWGWILTNISVKSHLLVAIWVPVILTILFMLRASALEKKFESFHMYLLKIENTFNLGDLGWETHLKNREGGWFGGSDRGWFGGFYRAFWPVLVAGNFLISIVIFTLEYWG